MLVPKEKERLPVAIKKAEETPLVNGSSGSETTAEKFAKEDQLPLIISDPNTRFVLLVLFCFLVHLELILNTLTL